MTNLMDYGSHEVVPPPLPSKSGKWLIEAQKRAKARGRVIWCFMCQAEAKPSCAEFPHP
jgi:hypothetical protein